MAANRVFESASIDLGNQIRLGGSFEGVLDSAGEDSVEFVYVMLLQALPSGPPKAVSQVSGRSSFHIKLMEFGEELTAGTTKLLALALNIQVSCDL